MQISHISELNLLLGAEDDWRIDLSAHILARSCFAKAYKNGWYHDPATGKPHDRSIPEMLCLIHSEISEALEGYRKGLADDKLPQHPMIAVELCDAAIRIFDLLGAYYPEHISSLVEKLQYNDTREDHKLANRAKVGGKAF